MDEDGKLHIVMFPWLSFDHIIPFLELAKLIAQKGHHRLSFISTPRNILRLPKLPPNLTPAITLVKLPLPRIAGLPENAEATMDVSSSQVHYLMQAFHTLETELTRFLEDFPADWIICDIAPNWLPQLASRLGISCAFFGVATAWCLALSLSQPLTVPQRWVPLLSDLAHQSYEQNYREDLEAAIRGCDAVLVRHSREFEPDWLNLLGEATQKPVIPVGLMPPSVQDSGDDKTYTWLAVSDWLSKQAKRSVVYVAFGNEMTLSQESLTELAFGLEDSGLCFFWALRSPPGSFKLPRGFEERTKGRGVVCRGWAPQVRILAHDSVGCFLTHCGWSSMIEGVACGQPLVMLPFTLHQQLNARVLTKNNVGLEIPRAERDRQFTRNSVSESLLLVMIGDEGNVYRKKAQETGGMFREKALQDEYIDNFVEYLQTNRRLKKGCF
ncbi:hypothetical protein RJ640_003914 [Escallonia rubra]|uniref:Glycosyltransferase n=1 Tax=Escallonia rubra TaxID=112253 RepID=A0AA88RMD5_9ASTE|nr:hypothetical protein RJ640_003914 [Escallonia rubra]